MSQQKSDAVVVAKGRRKTVPIVRALARGAKGSTVSQQSTQLSLNFVTAEFPASKDKGAVVQAVAHPCASASNAVPKAKSKQSFEQTARNRAVIEQLDRALQNVVANRGAPGPDRYDVETVRAHWPHFRAELVSSLSVGRYRPGLIRRVHIPKAGGGTRGLGIPNVIDRIVQEAVRLVLQPQYEPSFHKSSHGFRPQRSIHTAIQEGIEHLQEGNEWVVDLDLDSFFDRVNHQRLMARLQQRINDRDLLQLIERMLVAQTVLPSGVIVNNEQGIPQGGPLSPLLSNVVLHELDCELEQRKLRFVRYADDVRIFVRSERAGHRVKASITRFLEGRMRLRVNANKSVVSRPDTQHFLGFRLRRDPTEGAVQVLLSSRTIQRQKERIRELTPRSYGGSLTSCIKQVNEYLRGWIGVFGWCTEAAMFLLRVSDAHVRRRLRAIWIKDCKSKKSFARKLIGMGIKRQTAWSRVYEKRKRIWAQSSMGVVHRALTYAYFAERGLISLEQQWSLHPQRLASKQLTLFGDRVRLSTNHSAGS